MAASVRSETSGCEGGVVGTGEDASESVQEEGWRVSDGPPPPALWPRERQCGKRLWGTWTVKTDDSGDQTAESKRVGVRAWKLIWAESHRVGTQWGHRACFVGSNEERERTSVVDL